MKAVFLRLSFVLLFFVAASPGQETSAPAPQTTIRVNVDRVNVGVIVTGLHGQFVEGLHREDFRILDNGVEQPITGFLPIAEPAQVLFLVESGPAVFFLGRSHFQAAATLLNHLSPEDRVAIASYSKDPELLLDFTSDKPSARYALENLNFMAGFADLNLSSSLAAAIDWLVTLPGKKSVVVLSTGIDTSPPEKWPLIQQKLETADVRILAVSLSGDFRKPIKHKVLTAKEKQDRAIVKQGFAAADRSLRELALATGGRVYFPKDQKAFDRAYAEIAQLVRHEYSLAFTPPAHDGQLHTIEVKMKGFARRVDFRQAYVAPGPSVSQP
ncbi:MAG TPA: VWA domain-containing protein [Candidatus Angelobacter sp.]|nr:VWA domain-containing protein [Candidatus Angelobacter sp.]